MTEKFLNNIFQDIKFKNKAKLEHFIATSSNSNYNNLIFRLSHNRSYWNKLSNSQKYSIILFMRIKKN